MNALKSIPMKSLLVLTVVGAALATGACGTPSADATDTVLNSENAAARAAAPVVVKTAAPARQVYRDVTIPTGTTLPLALTSSVASDTSVVEDAVSALICHGALSRFPTLKVAVIENGCPFCLVRRAFIRRSWTG